MEEQKAKAEQRRQQSLGAMAAESGLYSTDRHQAAMDAAKEAQSQMANNLPVVGALKLLEEAGSGRDSITGREMGTGERLLATAGPATGVAAGFAAGIFGKPKIVAPKGAVGDAATSAHNFLGEGYKTITNKAGDTIFMSKDGLRKMRFDFNNPSGDLPHVHIEQFINGRWRDAIPGTHRIYPHP